MAIGNLYDCIFGTSPTSISTGGGVNITSTGDPLLNSNIFTPPTQFPQFPQFPPIQSQPLTTGTGTETWPWFDRHDEIETLRTRVQELELIVAFLEGKE